MKTSTKVLGAALLILLGILTIGIIGSRLYLNSILGSNYKERTDIILEENETMSFEVKDYSNINFFGVWEVEITRDSNYKLEIDGPRNLLGEIDVQQTGNLLTIRNNYKNIIGQEKFSIKMTIPELEGISIAGGADLSFDGFTGDKLDVTLSGAGRVRGFNSVYDNLDLVCSGAGQMDFLDLRSRNADVELSGAGEILVHMNGGELKGTISGMGSVKYKGSVSRESIKVSGLGEVSPR